MKQKITILFIILAIFMARAFSTEQEPDILNFQEQKLRLQTGWGDPSPLETYFLQNNKKSPFRMLSSANYRGFIATWKIENDKLYLTYIDNEKSKKNQMYKVFGKKGKEAVFADWFSGVIVAANFSFLEVGDDGKIKNLDSSFSYYIYVKKGFVHNYEKIPIFELANKNKEKNPKTQEMLSLNQRYISYYFRLWSDDSISYKNQEGRLTRKEGTSPILSYYSEDNLLWPYNWENKEKSGAPHCTWNVADKKIYLTDITLHTGTRFAGPDKTTIPLSELFKDANTKNGHFADWLNGIFIIQYGHDVEEGFYTRFEASENILISVKNGIIVKEYALGKNFDFSNRQKQYPPEIEALLKQW